MKQDAIRAEKEASSLRSWGQVYKSYKNFAHCDDGAIGEGFSESIAQLLSDKWNAANQLNRLITNDKGFETFVIHHIDELMSPAQAGTIRNNARSHCPPNVKALCEKIVARINETEP